MADPRQPGSRGAGQRPQLIKYRYELETQLAEGPVLDTWRALDRLHGQPVVVKLLRPRYGGDEKAGRRWFQQLARQRSRPLPDAPAMIEAGRDQERYFLVREYVEGPSLERWMNQRRTPDEALEVARQVLAALAEWHAAGLCHGQLHPANIILSPEGPILCDWDVTATTWNCFGVWAARRKHAVYLAPEVREAHTARPASDVYSVGVALWEMLCAQRLAPELHAVPPPSALAPGLPAGVDVVVEGMLKPDPNDRYPAAQAAEALAKLRSRAEQQVDRTPREKRRQRARERRDQVRKPLPWPVTVILVFYRFLFILVFTALVSGATLAGMAYGAFNYEKASIPPDVIVPDVIGKPVEQARSLFEDDLGLHFRISLKQGHPTIPAGAVINTTPEPGRRVRAGRTIEAVVSTGAELVTMPRLVNSPLDEARTTLERLGLKVGYTQESASDTVPKGAVISQDIGPGRKVAPQTKISLKVSTGPREQERDKPSDSQPAADDETHTTPEGGPQVKVKRVGKVRITVPSQANLTTVKIVVKDEQGPRTVYNQLHYAGDVVQTDIEGTGETVVEVWFNDQRVETKVL